MKDSFWLVVKPAQSIASISASAWFFTVGVPVKVETPPTCSVPLNWPLPVLLIVATVDSLAPPDPKNHPPRPRFIGAVQPHGARPRRIDHCLVVTARLPVVILPDRQPVHIVQLILHLVELLACRSVAQSHRPAISIVALVPVKEPALVPGPRSKPVVIGDRRVLLAPIPITIQAVETPVKCIEEAVACAVVCQLAGEHGSTCHRAVVRTARIRHNLAVRVLVPQTDNRVVLRVRP